MGDRQRRRGEHLGTRALKTMIGRLVEDHRLARRLAEALSAIPGIAIDMARVQTNIVRLDLAGQDARAVSERLKDLGVRVLATGPHTVRLVTNRHVTPDDVPVVTDAFRAALQA